MKMRRAFVLLILAFLLPACGPEVTRTEVKEICSTAPVVEMPEEIVCNYPESDTVAVDTDTKRYICTVTFEPPGHSKGDDDDE